jgi:TrmH family RNA methyltransferase
MMRRLFMIYGMKEINSNSNKYYKLCIQLSSRKYRDKLGLYLIEGENSVAGAAEYGVEIAALFVRDGYKVPDEFGIYDPYVVSKRLFDKMAQTETSQGIAAIVKKREYTEEEFFRLCGGGNVLALDRLQDPGNIGTAIRTAEAAGYGGAVILKGTGDIYSPKAVRASAGAIFRLPVLFLGSPEEALEVLKLNGKRTIAACPGAELCYFDADLRGDAALIIGNEGNGVCSEFLERSDVKVSIPMASGVDSLNVMVAAGIIMFESRRQIKNSREGNVWTTS